MNNKELQEKILNDLDERYELINVDYYDSLNDNQQLVEECINSMSLEPLYADDCYWESRYEAICGIIEEIALKYVSIEEYKEFASSEEWEWIRETIEDSDYSTPEEDIFLQTDTHARLELHSKFECLDLMDDYYATEEYFAQIINALYLNPKILKEKLVELGWGDRCKGTWRNLSYRNGKELVNYDDLVDIIVNCPNSSVLTFLGKMNMGYLIKNDFDTKDIIIPKGTAYTLYNSWLGGGSCEHAYTIRDISLKELQRRVKDTEYDLFELIVDERGTRSCYSSDEVYGRHLSDEYLF